MTTEQINHFSFVNINTVHKFKSVLLRFPFILEYLLLLLVLLPPPPLPSPITQPSTSQVTQRRAWEESKYQLQLTKPESKHEMTIQPLTTHKSQSSISYHVSAIEWNSFTSNNNNENSYIHKIHTQEEYCEIDLKIIEALQQANKDASTKSLAIFTDDAFDLSPNANSFLKRISNGMATVLQKICPIHGKCQSQRYIYFFLFSK